MDRRGEGVPAILARSTKLSGKRPVYELPGASGWAASGKSAVTLLHGSPRSNRCPPWCS